MNDEIEVDCEELFDFLEQICELYRSRKQHPNFSDRAFVDWVVVRAGQLYIQFVLEPECGHC